MTDIRDMHYTTETIERTVSGPYTGKWYGDMSDDVVLALLTVVYRFDGFAIVVKGIPAKWDRRTGSEYITGKVGRSVHDHVARIASALRRQRERGGTAPQTETRTPEERAREHAALLVQAAPKTVFIHPQLAA
jgi:hypothetical protein